MAVDAHADPIGDPAAQSLGDRSFLQIHGREVEIARLQDQSCRFPGCVGVVKNDLAQRGGDQGSDVHRQPVDGDVIARDEGEKVDPACCPGQNTGGGTTCAGGGEGTRPLSYDELVQIHGVASQARVYVGLAGKGDDLACTAGLQPKSTCGVL